MGISVFFLVLSFVTAVWGACHSNWHQYGESCYAFGQDGSFSWSDSQEMCRSFGGKLAEIETEEENKFLKSQAVLLGGHYWIGGSDVFSEGHWEWVTSSQPLFPFSDWIAGEPAGGTGESCLIMDRAYNYQWGDFPCARAERFICESDLESTVVG